MANTTTVHAAPITINHQDSSGLQVSVIKRELKVPDQFGPLYKSLISAYKTPASICGYIAPAVARIWATSKFQKYEMTDDEISELENYFANTSALLLLDYVEETMKFIQQDRSMYMRLYAHEWNNDINRSYYLTDWIAHFEISDFLKATGLDSIFFLRGVDPDISLAKHEERRRVDEEVPFHHLKYFVESYHKPEVPFTFSEDVYHSSKGKSTLQTPADWRQSYFANQLNSNSKISPICIVDLGGHFGVVRPILRVTVDGRKEPTLLLINSTTENYLDSPILDDFASLWFGQNYQL